MTVRENNGQRKIEVQVSRHSELAAQAYLTLQLERESEKASYIALHTTNTVL